MEGKARSGAQQPAIVLQSYIWPDAQSRRLIWISKYLKTGAEPNCESSLSKWDLPILCKFALGSKAFRAGAICSKKVVFSRERPKKVENVRVCTGMILLGNRIVAYGLQRYLLFYESGQIDQNIEDGLAAQVSRVISRGE